MAPLYQFRICGSLDRGVYRMATSNLQRDQHRSLYRSLRRHWTQSGQLDSTRRCSFCRRAHFGRYHLYVYLSYV